MQVDSFNLQSTFLVLKNKWKQLVLFVLASIVVASISLFLVPKQYQSASILVSANPVLADKAHLTNPQIQSLYSVFGSGDDLERIYGIASMDTVYKQLVDEFNLITYYGIKGTDQNLLRRKAMLELKDDISIQKTDMAQLKISIFTKNAALSANIVNRLVAITKTKEEAIWKEGYEKMLLNFNRSIDSLQKTYVALYSKYNNTNVQKIELDIIKMNSLLEKIQTQEKVAGEIQLAIVNNAPAMYVLEIAVPAIKSEKPNIPEVLLLTLLISFVFGVMALLVYYREESL